jgi:hypothetical protein
MPSQMIVLGRSSKSKYHRHGAGGGRIWNPEVSVTLL